MVYIPAGEFIMGRNNPKVAELPVRKTPEHPQHAVWVDAFYIDKYEVTNKQFEAFQPHERHKQSPCDDCPVTKVSWFNGRAYCESKGKRLPTEAEWEKAAKGGVTEEPTPLPLYAWIFGNSDNVAHPIGTKRPNGYGLYDMLGNVREWTTTWYDPGYYRLGENRNPKGPAEGKRRVERGGAFFLSPRGTTTTIRYNHPPEFRLYFLGFRCVQDP
jgi:formylglycine-generating enzyme required for sulfatase activity